LLEAIDNIKLDIDWQELSEFQYMNIRHGINNVGIPDLVILQNVMHNDLELFSLDKHFILMRNFLKFNLFRPPSVIP
jgi:hypothetical protein